MYRSNILHGYKRGLNNFMSDLSNAILIYLKYNVLDALFIIIVIWLMN